jgi:hypothetical protein
MKKGSKKLEPFLFGPELWIFLPGKFLGDPIFV